MKGKLVTEKIHRQLFASSEPARIAYTFLIHDTLAPIRARNAAQAALTSMPKRSHFTTMRPRSAITGIARGAALNGSVHRHEWKLWANRGLIPGIQRAMW